MGDLSLQLFPDAMQLVSHEFLRWAIICLTSNVNAGVCYIESVKHGDLHGVANGVVVAKLGKRQETGPVVELVVDIGAEVLFKGGVDHFCLPVCLQVGSST